MYVFHFPVSNRMEILIILLKHFQTRVLDICKFFLYYYRFQSLNKDSITVSQNLEENTKILEEQNKMVAQLSQLGLAG